METIKTHIFGILKTLGIAAIGLVIANLLGDDFPLFADSAFLTGILFAGLPFGWMALQSVLSFFTALGLIGVIIYVIVMFIGSVVVGWAIMLFRLGKDIIGLVVAIRSLTKVG